MKKLVRPKKGRVLGGVCMGLANYFKVDVAIIRIIWILLLIPGGLPGFFPYIILWIAIPEQE